MYVGKTSQAPLHVIESVQSNAFSCNQTAFPPEECTNCTEGLQLREEKENRDALWNNPDEDQILPRVVPNTGTAGEVLIRPCYKESISQFDILP